MYDRTRYCKGGSCRVQASKARNGVTSPSGLNARTKLRRAAIEAYGTTCIKCRKAWPEHRLLVRSGALCFKPEALDVRFAIVICAKCNSFQKPGRAARWRTRDGIRRLNCVREELERRGVHD